MNATLEQLVALAKEQGASDLHLEAGLPPAIRVRGALRTLEQPIPPRLTTEIAQSILGPDLWNHFMQRGSADLSRNIQGVRCRINVLRTARGVGLAVRLLATSQVTLDSLNLHPDFRKLVHPSHGLLIVTGATGSGKSSTVAALLEELNVTEARHIVTIESPIEFIHRPKRSYVRQREVGRDTPSFEQALLDALREDPDVIVVGEMRDAATMKLTLNAAETGHLVITTMHSSTPAEALQRLISAFEPEIQPSVRAQVADCLVGLLAQRLRFRQDLKIRVPECELLLPTHAIRSFIRTGEFHKIMSSLETGAEHGMWTYARYSTWLENRKSWFVASPPLPEDSEVESNPTALPSSAPTVATTNPFPPSALSRPNPIAPSAPDAPPQAPQSRRIDIEPIEGAVDELLKNLKPR